MITEPRPIRYAHSDTLVLDYLVDDGCTGVASVAPKLEGSATVAGHGLDDGQAIHLLTELALENGKTIDAMAAKILITDAQYLIAHCP